MTGRRWQLYGLVIFIVLLVGAAVVQPAMALSFTGLNVTLNCADWSYGDFDFTADRDNTNANAEAYDITITDGKGTLLHFVPNAGIPLGSYSELGVISAYNQGVAPQYNPLTFTWTSRAGNGFSAQIAYTASGNCPGLPVFGTSTGSAGKVIDGEVQFDPGDDRLNRENKDRAAPVAIYCMEWGIEIRVIDYASSRGIDPPAITALYPDVEAVGVPSVNTLLGEGNGVRLYRLTTGEFAVFTRYANENKAYIFVWDQCPVPTIKYHAAV